LPSLLAFAAEAGVWRPVAEHLRLPIQERRTGFTHVQKCQVLVAAVAAGCRPTRDSDFTLTPDPAAAAAPGLPRWPQSSQLMRYLGAFHPPRRSSASYSIWRSNTGRRSRRRTSTLPCGSPMARAS
jgi:hypothetical protein